MLKSSIDPSCAQDLFDSARNAGAKGQAQWFTPPDVASALCQLLPENRRFVADLNCGNGQLLRGSVQGHLLAAQCHLFGLDIAKTRQCALNTDNFHRVQADLVSFFPLLRAVEWTCPLFVLNPPWDLHWYRSGSAGGPPAPAGVPPADSSGLSCLAHSDLPAVREAFAAHDGRVPRECIDSTVATLMMALDRLPKEGEGILIANHATMVRLLGSAGVSPAAGGVPPPAPPTAPHSSLRRHVWLWLQFPGNLCDPKNSKQSAVDSNQTDHSSLNPDHFATAALFFARDHTTGPGSVLPASFRQGELITGHSSLNTLRQRRMGSCLSAYDWYSTTNRVLLWQAAAEEWARRRLDRPNWNLWLHRPSSSSSSSSDGIICTHLNLYDEIAGKIDKASTGRLHKLGGRRPMDLVMMRNERKELLWATGIAERGTRNAETSNPRSSIRNPHSDPSPWRVEPALVAAVQAAVTEYHAQRAPLYPLPKIQRLGHLDEDDDILCIQEFSVFNHQFSELNTEHLTTSNSRPAFQAGHRYPLRTETVTVSWNDTKYNLAGNPEALELTGQELIIQLQDDDGRWHTFVDARHRDHLPDTVAPEGRHSCRPSSASRTHHSSLTPVHSLQDLADHFDIPEVPDVATVRPEEFQRHRQTLQQLEALCP